MSRKIKIALIFLLILIICLSIGKYFFNYAIVNKNPKGISVEYIKKDENKLAVIVHGYKSDSSRMFREKEIFERLGYSVLLIDNQSKYYTFGVKEKEVVIENINKYKAKDVILYGMSMGAATVLQAASSDNFPKNVKLLIVDSPYDEIYKVFKHELKKRFHLPEYPVLPLARLVTKYYTGVDIKKIRTSENINKINIPILFLHGGADDFVEIYHSKKIYEEYKGIKEYVTFEGIAHSKMDKEMPEEYERYIREFVKKYEK